MDGPSEQTASLEEINDPSEAAAPAATIEEEVEEARGNEEVKPAARECRARTKKARGDGMEGPAANDEPKENAEDGESVTATPSRTRRRDNKGKKIRPPGRNGRGEMETDGPFFTEGATDLAEEPQENEANQARANNEQASDRDGRAGFEMRATRADLIEEPNANRDANELNGDTVNLLPKTEAVDSADDSLPADSGTAAARSFQQLLQELSAAHERELLKMQQSLTKLDANALKCKAALDVPAISPMRGNPTVLSHIAHTEKKRPHLKPTFAAKHMLSERLSSIIKQDLEDLDEGESDDEDDDDWIQDVSGDELEDRAIGLPSTAQRAPTFLGLPYSIIIEMSVASIIIIMVVVMAAEAEYVGSQIGRNDLNYDHQQHPAFVFFDWFFGIFFTIEIGSKLAFALFKMEKKYAHRAESKKGETKCVCHRFFYEKWNWFDAFLVAAWLVEVAHVIRNAPGLLFLRIIRLLKLGRLIKVLLVYRKFDNLYVLLNAMIGGLRILGEIMLVMGLIQISIAMLMNQCLIGFISDESKPIEARQLIWDYYGTFGRSLLSSFELTLANWPPIIRMLTENVSEWFILFGIAHKLMIGFALVGVVNGVFIQETFRCTGSDDRIMMRRKETAAAIHKQKMNRLFVRADVDRDGQISYDQFKFIMSDPGIRTWLSAMELDLSDIGVMFELLDIEAESPGGITESELVQGVGRLKGYARSLDLAIAMNEVIALGQDMDTIKGTLQAVLAKVSQGN